MLFEKVLNSESVEQDASHGTVGQGGLGGEVPVSDPLDLPIPVSAEGETGGLAAEALHPETAGLQGEPPPLRLAAFSVYGATPGAEAAGAGAVALEDAKSFLPENRFHGESELMDVFLEGAMREPAEL